MTAQSRGVEGQSDSDERVAHRIALTNVRVFDGNRLLDPGTVVIDGGTIGTDRSGAEVLDTGGAILLPGLIDAHVHLLGIRTLEQLTDFGVTTALDMGNWPIEAVDGLREQRGLADIRSAGIPLSAPGSRHSEIPGYPADGLLDGAAGAEKFVADRVAEGSDYIKVIADAPGPDAATLRAAVSAAHAHGKRVVAHATSVSACRMTIDAGADFLTHAPLDNVLDDELITRMAAAGTVIIPTLTMMSGVASLYEHLADQPSGPRYTNAEASVTALHRAGIPILAGTDANNSPGIPAQPPYGESLHTELELLVAAGLSTVEALRAATTLPANHFRLPNRGTITPGHRADLVLIDGDPIADIRATRSIRHVWCAGIDRLAHPA